MHVVVHKWLIRQGSSAHCDPMAPADLTLTNLLAYICHLRPASLNPCERTVSSAWLQPLCGRTITGRARPPPAGGGTRRLSAECLCVVRGSCGPVGSQSVLIYMCAESDLKEETKLLCGC